MSITLNRIGFFIRHIARMRRTREALNQLLPPHQQLIGVWRSGTIVLNACTAYISAQHFAQNNPDAHVFASQTFTVVSEPHIIMTPEGPRTRGVVHGTHFLTPLVWGERMQRFMRSSPDRAHR